MPVTRCVNSRLASGSTSSVIWVLDVGGVVLMGRGLCHTHWIGVYSSLIPPPPTSNTQIILPVSGSGCIWSVARLQGRSAKRPLFDIVSMSLHALHLITSNNFTSKCQYFIVK